MYNKKTKEDNLEKIVLAVRSVVDQFENRGFPSKIVLKNYEGFENFKQVLERELILMDYNTTIVINQVNNSKKVSEDNQEKTDYIIDVINYLNQDKYPGRLM